MANPAEKDANKNPPKTTIPRAKAGWVVAVFFIAAWMFGMGVMVGRETAPVRFDLDQLKKTLESLQRAPREPLKNAPPAASTEMKEKTKLDFYEVLPKNREDAEVNLPKPTPPGPASAKAEPPAAKTQETSAQARTDKPPPLPAAPPAPKTEKPAPVPASPPPPASAAAAPGQAFTRSRRNHRHAGQEHLVPRPHGRIPHQGIGPRHGGAAAERWVRVDGGPQVERVQGSKVQGFRKEDDVGD